MNCGLGNCILELLGNLPGIQGPFVEKDTVAVPAGGYVVIRFVTSNFVGIGIAGQMKSAMLEHYLVHSCT